MFSERMACPVQDCVLASRWLTAALTVLLILSAAATCAHTTVEQDFHIVHNVDNRSPEIDPMWYVVRGVRPIGRFGKRSGTAGGSRGFRPAPNALELLLSAIRNKENFGKTPYGEEDSDWLP